MEVEIEKPGHLQRIFSHKNTKNGQLQRSIFLHGTGGILLNMLIIRYLVFLLFVNN